MQEPSHFPLAHYFFIFFPETSPFMLHPSLFTPTRKTTFLCPSIFCFFSFPTYSSFSLGQLTQLHSPAWQMGWVNSAGANQPRWAQCHSEKSAWDTLLPPVHPSQYYLSSPCSLHMLSFPCFLFSFPTYLPLIPPPHS